MYEILTVINDAWLIIVCPAGQPRQVYSCIQLSNYQPIKKGAYAELIGIDPEIIQVLLLFPLQRMLLLSSLLRLIQPDVIEIHLAGTAWDRRVALCIKTDSDPINVG